ncbi:MAG: hypothetical protein WCI73_15900 [Phycisphaerae bacterium]
MGQKRFGHQGVDLFNLGGGSFAEAVETSPAVDIACALVVPLALIGGAVRQVWSSGQRGARLWATDILSRPWTIDSQNVGLFNRVLPDAH